MKYFPLTKSVLSEVGGTNIQEEFVSLLNQQSIASLCPLLVLSQLTRSADISVDQIERALAQVFDAVSSTPLSEFKKTVIDRLNVESISGGFQIIEEKTQLQLLPEDLAEKRPFLTPSGKWRFGWEESLQQRDVEDHESLERYFERPVRFTEDQMRVLNVVLADDDESIDIQGFAGTGKTHVISALIDLIPSNQILFCAMNAQQLSHLRSRVAKGVSFMTFGQLTSITIDTNMHWKEFAARFKGYRTKPSYRLSQAEMIQKLGITDNKRAGQITQYTEQTVNRFCLSGSRSISSSHLPYWAEGLNNKEKELIVSLAQLMWQLTIEPIPNDSRPFPLRQYHQIKYLSLTDQTLPLEYSHIIFDEAHDLSLPIRQIIERSPQAIYCFGDEYQRLGIRPNLSRRLLSRIRCREMSHSFRAGKEADGVYNAILDSHPIPAVEQFHGAKTKHTQISYYDDVAIPEHPTAILSIDSYHVFNVAMRLVHSGAPTTIASRTLSDMRWLISDLIELYHHRIQFCTHPDLRKHSSWDSILKKKRDPILGKIHQAIEKGFDQTELENLCAKVSGRENGPMYCLARIEDSKNHEFDQVMLLSDALHMLENQNPASRAFTLNNLYVGISRARHSLIVPGVLESWLQDFSRTVGSQVP